MGVVFRILIGVNLMGMVTALMQAGSLIAWPERYLDEAFRLQPALLVSLGLLALMSPYLRRLPVMLGRVVVVGGVALVAVVLEGLWRLMWLSDISAIDEVGRLALIAGGAAAIMIGYFVLVERAQRPAVQEAQLNALTARIRPHFLFNSLNAVLSLIRKEPQRAEIALENLAELFRVLMRDPRDLALLSEEIELCRQYLDLERLRLGDRLRVEWAIEAMPADVRIPPLMLQPLLENAIYHGIEPAPEGGLVHIAFERRADQLRIVVVNPVSVGGQGAGNRMALENIRQRLALHYDLEATLEAGQNDGEYRVMIELPLRSTGSVM